MTKNTQFLSNLKSQRFTVKSAPRQTSWVEGTCSHLDSLCSQHPAKCVVSHLPWSMARLSDEWMFTGTLWPKWHRVSHFNSVNIMNNRSSCRRTTRLFGLERYPRRKPAVLSVNQLANLSTKGRAYFVKFSSRDHSQSFWENWPRKHRTILLKLIVMPLSEIATGSGKFETWRTLGNSKTRYKLINQVMITRGPISLGPKIWHSVVKNLKSCTGAVWTETKSHDQHQHRSIQQIHRLNCTHLLFGETNRVFWPSMTS
jgi:hypothetical protein